MLRRTWTAEEDRALKEIIEEVGTKQWSLVSFLMEQKHNNLKRSAKQCRERWVNQLNPLINNAEWTLHEEQTLLAARRKFGNKWCLIANELPGRTENSVKNHFYSAIRRNLRKYNKDKPQNERIKGPISSLIQDSRLCNILLEFSTERTTHKPQPTTKNLKQITCENKESNKIPEWSDTVFLLDCSPQANPVDLPGFNWQTDDDLYAASPLQLVNSTNFKFTRGDSLNDFDLQGVQESVLCTYANNHTLPDFIP